MIIGVLRPAAASWLLLRILSLLLLRLLLLPLLLVPQFKTTHHDAVTAFWVRHTGRIKRAPEDQEHPAVFALHHATDIFIAAFRLALCVSIF